MFRRVKVIGGCVEILSHMSIHTVDPRSLRAIPVGHCLFGTEKRTYQALWTHSRGAAVLEVL